MIKGTTAEGATTTIQQINEVRFKQLEKHEQQEEQQQLKHQQHFSLINNINNNNKKSTTATKIQKSNELKLNVNCIFTLIIII